jgi:hypothetical protein
MTVGWNCRKRWEFKLMLKCRHQCHCACTSEIRTCIINETGRQATHTKKQRKYTCCFWSNHVKRRFILMVWRLIDKKKTFIENTKLTGTIRLRTTQFQFCIKYYWFKFLIYTDALDTLKITICFYDFAEHF